MPVSDAQVVALAHAHQARLASIVARLTALVGVQWLRWRPIGDTELAGFVAAVSPVVDAAKTSAVRQAVTYIGAVAVMAGESFTAPDAALILGGHRGGLPTGEVWSRPTITARAALAAGRTVTEALAAGRGRVDMLALDDVAIAGRDAVHESMRGTSGVVGYQRIPNARACLFCQVAATQRYKVEDLMPLHNRCSCTSAPIIGDVDPGRVVDRQRYAELKQSGQLDEFNRAQARRSQSQADSELGARLVTS